MTESHEGQPAPRRIEPTSPQKKKKSKRGKWITAFMTAIVAIIILTVGAFLMVGRDHRTDSTDGQIRKSVDTFSHALRDGDIATLRTSTCGALAGYYRNISDAQFADVYKISVDQKNIPVVQKIDRVQVTGTTAIAQVTAYTLADPATKSPRTFSLQKTDQGWKVYDSPT